MTVSYSVNVDLSPVQMVSARAAIFKAFLEM